MLVMDLTNVGVGENVIALWVGLDKQSSQGRHELQNPQMNETHSRRMVDTNPATVNEFFFFDETVSELIHTKTTTFS